MVTNTWKSISDKFKEMVRRSQGDDSSNKHAETGTYPITVGEKFEMLCKDLGISIVSSVEKLNPDSIVIFASYHSYYKIEAPALEYILLRKLNSGKKTILGVEFPKDFADLLNDPKRNFSTDNKFNLVLNSEPVFRRFVEVFREIQQKYSRDMFEVKPFDVKLKEKARLNMAMVLLNETRTMESLEAFKKYDEKRNTEIVKNILYLLKKYDNLVVWTGAFHVEGLLTKLKESGNKDRIVVFLTPEAKASVY